jgi:excisionase family DNA binding protein
VTSVPCLKCSEPFERTGKQRLPFCESCRRAWARYRWRTSKARKAEDKRREEEDEAPTPVEPLVSYGRRRSGEWWSTHPLDGLPTGEPTIPEPWAVGGLDNIDDGGAILGRSPLRFAEDRLPAGYTTARGPWDEGVSTLHRDLQTELATRAANAAEHPWWAANPHCFWQLGNDEVAEDFLRTQFHKLRGNRGPESRADDQGPEITTQITEGPAMTLRQAITVTEAARQLGVSRRFIYRRIAEGKLPAYRVGEAALRVDLYDVQEFAKPVEPSEVAA